MSAVQNIAVPPHNLEAEKSVLGAVLLDDRHLYPLLVEEQLRAEHFYREAHGLVFAAMLQLYESDRKIDHLTVAETLRQHGKLEDAGGAEAIEELAGWVPSAGHARDYGRIVRDHAQMRALLTASYDIQASVLSREAPARELVERAERSMLEVAHDDRQKKIRTIADILHEETDKLHRLSVAKTALTGTPSGFKDLDEKTGGFQPGNLIVIAARPSMGKSALVANIAENAVLSGHAVALFSLEMSESELAQRFVASQARIKGEDLRRGRVPENRWPKILEACQRLSQAPLFVDDSSDTGVLEVRAKARRLHHQIEGGLGLIIIDYLQLMRHEGRVESRVEQVGQISRGLKGLARELGVPVIALSQLSRAVEQRGGEKKPILSDLRECVTGETRVMLADGRRLPIRELVATTPEVLALDERHRIVRARSDAIWAVGCRKVFRLRLASGRSLRATADHRVLARSGWTRLSELSIGDHVGIARQVPEAVSPDRWPADRVVLLAHLIGDGSYLKDSPLRYSTASEENSVAVTRAAQREFRAEITRLGGGSGWHQLQISAGGDAWNPAEDIADWLRELGIYNQRPNEKRIPSAAFRLTNEQIALLLRHLWATDGLISAGYQAGGQLAGHVHYTTPSSGLAEDVAALLLRLGIVARITSFATGTQTVSNVVIAGSAAQRRFLAAVGAFGPRRPQAAALNAALPAAESNLAALPLQHWREVLVKRVEDALPIRVTASTWAAQEQASSAAATDHADVLVERSPRAGMSRSASDSTLRAMASLREMAAVDAPAVHPSAVDAPAVDVSPPRVATAIAPASAPHPVLLSGAQSDVFWDLVAAIEEEGEEQVYDLTVPGPASWLADGVITHNSGQIEQDSDLVMFIYREEYYEKESERPGEADIIIAKHRNGPVGDVVLTFQKEYPKFMNYAGERFAS